MRGQLLPGKAEAASKAWREVIEPMLQRAKGWRGSYVLTHEGGELLLMSLWESREDASAVDRQFEGAMQRFGNHFAAHPQREVFDLRVHSFPRLGRRLQQDN
jgi:heme-degrading monooxygenase HmoA